MIKNILTYISIFITIICLTACADDFPTLFGVDAEGMTEVRLDLDFMPMGAKELHTRATNAPDGDSMSDIRDLCIVMFNADGTFHELINAKEQQGYTEMDVERGNADASGGQIAGEVETKRGSLTLRMEAGSKLYIYAVANLDTNGKSTYDYLMADFDIENKNREQFCTMRRRWDSVVYSNNSEMAGFFTDGSMAGSEVKTASYGNDDVEKPVYIRQGMTLHCWLRRLASKVSVGFDATNLDENTTIYIKEVRIHDIPYDCQLMRANHPAIDKDDPNKAIVGDGGLLDDAQNEQVLVFGEGNIPSGWPRLTSGRKNLDDFQNLHKIGHANDHKALFLYENMQNDGESKLQDAEGNVDKDGNPIPDGVIDSPNSTVPGNDHYKDNKPAGSYIEVKAYYVSEAVGNVGRGEITYRFMLGKNVVNNYDVERNYHYKLTLVFKGYANDYDWHIEYKQRTNEITIPNPYYISYGYNESLELPISIMGEVEMVTATVIRNDWWPSELWEDVEADLGKTNKYHYDRNSVTHIDEDKSIVNAQRDSLYQKLIKKDYYKNDDSRPKNMMRIPQVLRVDTFRKEGVANGFLSLKNPSADILGDNDINAAAGVPKIYNVWKDRNLGQRFYGTLNAGTFGNEKDGTYRVEISNRDNVQTTKTTMYLPLYTRQKNLYKSTGYSGENPYNTNQRRAQVLYSFKIKGRAEPLDTLIDIIQVAKIENPVGIWRDWNNASPFDVVLKLRYGMDNNDFRNLRSVGPWSAEVEYGNDWILLNGGRRKIYGGDGDNIAFTYRPAGTLEDSTKVRCGVILVRYHNYSCVHRIFVRQGYAPIKVNDTSNSKYFSFNMVAKGVKASSPLEEGSMFRYGNWDWPIASDNNYNDTYPNDWINVTQKSFADHTNTPFHIALQKNEDGTDKTGYWQTDIKSTQNSKAAKDTYVWNDDKSSETFTFEGKTCRLLSVEDISRLRNQDDKTDFIRHAYGVLYGDKATSTATYMFEAYSFLAGDPVAETYGMRGCLVYNINDGRQIFFPIGKSGFGHRKAKRSKSYIQNEVPDALGWSNAEVGSAVLRYASARITAMDKAPDNPLLFDIYRRPGAWYWTNSTQDMINAVRSEEKNRTALDINYFTFDFNTLGDEPFSGTGSDACYIRLVQVD